MTDSMTISFMMKVKMTVSTDIAHYAKKLYKFSKNDFSKQKICVIVIA